MRPLASTGALLAALTLTSAVYAQNTEDRVRVYVTFVEPETWPDALREAFLLDLRAGLARSDMSLVARPGRFDAHGVHVIMGAHNDSHVSLLIHANRDAGARQVRRRLELDGLTPSERSLLVSTSVEELARSAWHSLTPRPSDELGPLAMATAASHVGYAWASARALAQARAPRDLPVDPPPARAPDRALHSVTLGFDTRWFTGGVHTRGARGEYALGPSSAPWRLHVSAAYHDVAPLPDARGVLRGAGVGLGLGGRYALARSPTGFELGAVAELDLWLYDLQGVASSEMFEGLVAQGVASTARLGPSLRWSFDARASIGMDATLGWTLRELVLRSGALTSARIGGAAASLTPFIAIAW